jgi:hypothetical protein
MRKFSGIAFILLLVSTGRIFTQDLGAYIDYMDRFYVFDKGKSMQIEDLRPESFDVGGECILYQSSAGHLKMYANGKVEELEITGVSKYNATDHLAVYNIYEKLKVVYRGEVIELSNRCTNYFAADSLVVFYDKNQESLRVFYKGQVSDIESGMVGTPVTIWSGGDNLVAYISARTNDFKIWYNGQVHTIYRNVQGTRFMAGRDVVAYTDVLEQNFKAFYRGEIVVLDEFVPKSYKVADDFVAFVSQNGEFKLFANGEVQTISTYEPEGYLAEDNILAYAQDNYFKIWYKGEVIELENFIPAVYKLDWNTVAYLDQSNRIWLYQNGKKNYLANEFVNEFHVYRDLIIMNVKVDRNIIYYQNEFFEGASAYK